jgi:4-alpha-glucanotransferase
MLEVAINAAKEERTKKNKVKKIVVTETKKPTTTIATVKTEKKAPTAKKIVTKKAAKQIVEEKKVEAVEATIEKQKTKNKKQKTIITFQLKFTTTYGQSLFITGNHQLLGNGNITQALPMQYFNDEFWYANIDLTDIELKDEAITYNYFLKSLDGTVQYDCGNDKQFNLSKIKNEEILILDGWNYTGYAENAFYTVPFQNVFIKRKCNRNCGVYSQKIHSYFSNKNAFACKRTNTLYCW